MSNEWVQYNTGDLISRGILAIGDGYRAKNSELASKGLPFARAGNINNGFHFDDADRFPENNLHKVGEKVSHPGDVVFTSKGTVGRFAFVRDSVERFVYSPQLCYWRSLNSQVLNPGFLYYWMHGREFYEQFSRVKSQTDMADYVNLKDQRRMQITLPPLPEQRAIAHILGSLDDKIELNGQMNQTLEAMARALFKAWFVDFEPVRARQNGQVPTSVDPATAALFPDRLVESELGPVPEGWRVGIIGEVALVNRQSTSSGYPYKTIEYIDISSVTEGKVEQTTTYLLSEAPSRARRLVEHGDTIWSTVRPNRKSYLFIHTPPRNLVVSTGFAVLSPCKVPPNYLYCWVIREEFVEYLTYNATGSAYPAVNANRFVDAKILVPPQQLLQKFEEIVEPIRDRIAHNDQESRTLAELRDALLPKLISGQLRVPGMGIGQDDQEEQDERLSRLAVG